MAEKTQTNQTKPTKTNQPNQLKPLGLPYFCELSMYARFQLPRLCLSCISMVEEEKKRKESAVLMATLATAQVELSLSWGLAKVDQNENNVINLDNLKNEDKLKKEDNLKKETF